MPLWPRACAMRCMLTLLPRRMSATFACCGSCILSASCPLVPALSLLLCAQFLPALSFWLGRLLLMRPCLLVNVCLLLAWCTVACALFRCRALPVLPGVAHPPSTPSEVPRPQPLWGKAWSPTCFFLFTWHWDGLKSAMRACARVQIPVCLEPPLFFSHELLGGLRTGFLVVSSLRIACVFLHVERGRSSKREWRSPRIVYLFTWTMATWSNVPARFDLCCSPGLLFSHNIPRLQRIC
jgi:hypothetical protein